MDSRRDFIIQCALDNDPGLTKIFLSYANITDISFMKGNTHVTHLHLFGNKISDPSPLKSNNTIISLDLSANLIETVDFLKDNETIIALDVRFKRIHDISALFGCVRLCYLKMNYNGVCRSYPVKKQGRCFIDDFLLMNKANLPNRDTTYHSILLKNYILKNMSKNEIIRRTSYYLSNDPDEY
jgi:hypothetical protein